MWGIIAITSNGLLLAKKVKGQFPDSVIYTLPKWKDDDTEVIEGHLSSFTGTLFARHRTLVFIMATGIVVRSIAKHLESKTSDPAVLVMDEQGKFVISLLSGHLGGANAVATLIAEKIPVTPVITTASDGQGLPSVDIIAQTHGLLIASMHDAKIITAMTVNGQKVGLRNDSALTLPDYYPCPETEAGGLVIVGSQQLLNEDVPYAQLIPQTITIGVGCRRGVPGDKIIAFVHEMLDTFNVSQRAISQLASIEIKADEAGILEAAAHFGVQVQWIAAADIGPIEDQFTASAFVKAQVGVSGVCEPAAFIAGGRKGRFICQKQSKEGITVAIFESAR